ncbi:MAG: hypothetical protein WD770_09360 [Actinomycetota bacterium]
MPYADHGDPNNLVEEHLKKAGETETIGKAGTKAARENTLELLQLIKDAGEMEKPKEQY